MSVAGKQVINVPVHNLDNMSSKPAIARKLEQESLEYLKKKNQLTSEQLEKDHRIADERRQKVLASKVERAEELEKGRSRSKSPEKQQHCSCKC